MLSQVFQFFINTIHSVFNLLTRFHFEDNITLYSIALFLIFARIVIFMISYLKDVMNVLEEHDVKDFQYNKRQDYWEAKRKGGKRL